MTEIELSYRCEYLKLYLNINHSKYYGNTDVIFIAMKLENIGFLYYKIRNSILTFTYVITSVNIKCYFEIIQFILILLI